MEALGAFVLPNTTTLPTGTQGQIIRGSDGLLRDFRGGSWQLLAPSSSGVVNTTTGTVDFGLSTTDSASVVISAAWVTALSNISLSVRGFAPDHPPEDDDVWLEQVSAYVTTIIPATSFTVVATAPDGTWGRYTISVIGV